MTTRTIATNGLRAMPAAIAMGILIAWPHAQAPTATPQQEGSCRLGGDLQVQPTSVPVDGTVSVTLTADHRCAKRQIAVGFATISSFPLQRAACLEEAATWLHRVDLTFAEVALVAMRPPEVVQPLTSDRALLVSSMGKIPNEYFGQPHKTIEQARLELLRGRVPGLKPDQAIVNLGDQIHRGQEADAAEQANLAKAAGIEFYTTGTSYSYRKLASSPRHFFEILPPISDPNIREATSAALRAVEKSIEPRGFASSVVTATVPLAMRYVAGSSVPPARWDPQQHVLVWSHSRPSGVITMTFQLEPEVCGPLMVGDGSYATGLDLAGQMYRHDYIGQPVDVPCASPTPVPSATPTATRTPTATPTASATAPPRQRPVYLPLLLKEPPCDPKRQRLDVALVVDASSSMLEPTRQGRTKLAAAVEAVGLFLNELDLPHDQAAMVEFNGGVRLLAPLSGDRGRLADALGRLAVQQQTRIDLGVETAHQELTSPRRRAGNEAVMIVLTDGRANPVGPEVAVAQAAAAKADGITVFTIGLGEELDEWALAAMASKPEYYHRAPDGEDLKAIYQAIAVEIPCPAEEFWGRR